MILRYDQGMTTHTDTNVKTIENATPGDVRAGDYVVWEYARESGGATFTERREGIAHSHDRYGDWFTEDGIYLTLGAGEGITITIRRTVQELPTKPDSVIVPADGRDYIEATLWGETFYARAALRSWTGWHAAWRAGERKCGLASSGEITPGTWKVADQ